MRPSFLTGLALFMNGPQLTQLFADLRFTEKVLRESKHTEENPLLIKLFGTAPEEILIEILSQLDGYDLLRCQRVRFLPYSQPLSPRINEGCSCFEPLGQPLLP